MCNAFSAIPNINQLNTESLITGLLGMATASSQPEGNTTKFAELGGNVRFDKGIARNDDLVMKSPLLRVTGEGEADLPKNRVRYVATVALVSSCQGQGGQDFHQLAGLPIPVIIKGPLDKPKFYPKIDSGQDHGGLGARTALTTCTTATTRAGSAATQEEARAVDRGFDQQKFRRLVR